MVGDGYGMLVDNALHSPCVGHERDVDAHGIAEGVAGNRNSAESHRPTKWDHVCADNPELSTVSVGLGQEHTSE